MLETTIKQIKEEAREEGVEEGRAQGREEGREEGVEQTALNMIIKGMDDSTIIELTELSPETISMVKKWIGNMLGGIGDYTEEFHKSFTGARDIKIMFETKLKQIKEKGREEGIEKGIEEGREEGIREGMEQIALNMIKKGMNNSTIIEITKLSSEKIKELKRKSD